MDRLALTHLLAENVVTQADRARTRARRADHDRRAADGVRTHRPGSDRLGVRRVARALPRVPRDARHASHRRARTAVRGDARCLLAPPRCLDHRRRNRPAPGDAARRRRSGCYLGGFGFVENVRPADPGAPLGGFIHAPSPAHAGAAAILRNGFLSRGGSGSAYDVDLSSARVRAALTLIDGVRQGEPLDSLLGQTPRTRPPRPTARSPDRTAARILPARRRQDIRRRRADRARRGRQRRRRARPAAGMERKGRPVRRRRATCPRSQPASSRASTPPSTPSTTRRRARRRSDRRIDLPGRPRQPDRDRSQPRRDGSRRPAPDARGNPDAARRANSFTQRLAIALAPGAAPADDWGRRRREPPPSPHSTTGSAPCSALRTRSAAASLFPDGSNHDVRLDALALRPLDLVALARTRPTGLGDGELDRRVLAAATAPVGAQVHYDITTVGMEPGRRARARRHDRRAARRRSATRSRRPRPRRRLRSRDRRPVRSRRRRGSRSGSDRSADGRGHRTRPGARGRERRGGRCFEPRPAGGASRRARAGGAYGVVGAYPPADADADALVTLAAWVKNELAQRRPAASRPRTQIPARSSPPPARPSRRSSVATSSSCRSSTRTTWPRRSPRRTRFSATRTRRAGPCSSSPACGRTSGAGARCGSTHRLSAPRAPPLEVAQLPAAYAWAGNPGAEIASGTLSLILHRPTHAPPPAAGSASSSTSGPRPSPRPRRARRSRSATSRPSRSRRKPCCSPSRRPTAPSWDRDTLLDTVRETLILAKIRAVDSSLLDSLRPFLPAICLTGNTANETVSTDFLGSIVAEPGLRIA